MTNKTSGKKIPRKFAEKIALLNKKQSESNAEFENIIKEVERTTRTVTASTVPGRYIVGIHKRRNSNVRGMADNLVNSYIDLNVICKQAEYEESKWHQSGQFQPSYHSTEPAMVESAPSMVPDITIFGTDEHYTTDDYRPPKVSATETVVTPANTNNTNTNANYATLNDGYLNCHVPYSRANARSLPNIWDGINGGSANNICGNQSPRIGLSPASSMQRLTLEQRYNDAIACGNNNNNNYLNHRQQVPCNSWNGSGHQLNQQRRPSYSDQIYHQNHYHSQTQPQILSRTVSSTCLPSIASGGHYNKPQQDNLYAPTSGGYMSRSISNNIGYAGDRYQHQLSFGDRSPQQYNNSGYHQLQTPSSITRSHSIGDICDVNSYQKYSSSNSNDANNKNSSNYYSYSSSEQSPPQHYHNNHRSQDASYSTESYSNNQCYECSGTYYQTA